MTTDSLDRALAPFVDELITPALVIDLDAVAANLRATLERVGGAARWRPHLKTSKQAVIIEAMLDAGLRHFKVATCDELELLLATAGDIAVDVLLAYPLQRAALLAALGLARAHAHATVQLLADSPAHLAALASWVRSQDFTAPLPIMLDVDLGMQRTGSPPAIWRELEAVPAPLVLTGLHGYDGHLGWDQRGEAHRGYDALVELAAALEASLEAALESGAAALELVTSGTHSYAHALDHAGLRGGPWQHRVSPGTIVLSDSRSHHAAADIGLRSAAFVATRVISVGPGRVTLDAGSKGISPDVAPPSCAVLDHPELEPQRPSEEHLPCRVAAGAAGPTLGQLLWLLPAHVCTTVNLHREAVWIRDGRYVGVGPVGASGHRPRFAPADSIPPRTARPPDTGN
ncbi:D-threonine aldolase [Enhygromyxa salina]|uniref:D-threonine aldolase n=1 Tax=Enhygromyxa salina TaxID=215803 RepID=A0A2S9XDL1_9BACT|nr:alanine racemase [Enhygromyxa salina]PRP90850.1 D-threonine aldolase [Enhygromyxa salina]